MFELGNAVEKSAELPEVQLQETSDVLEIALPYVYPVRLKPFKLDVLPSPWPVIAAFDKYEVRIGAKRPCPSLKR